MNRILFAFVMGFALVLAACGKLEPVQPIESVESLVANPDRLKELRVQCKADHAKVGDAQCNAVAEATRRRFFSTDGPKYTPPASPPAAFSPPAASAAVPPASASPPAPKD